jgi:hypothetical protein
VVTRLSSTRRAGCPSSRVRCRPAKRDSLEKWGPRLLEKKTRGLLWTARRIASVVFVGSPSYPTASSMPGHAQGDGRVHHSTGGPLEQRYTHLPPNARYRDLPSANSCLKRDGVSVSQLWQGHECAIHSFHREKETNLALCFHSLCSSYFVSYYLEATLSCCTIVHFLLQ